MKAVLIYAFLFGLTFASSPEENVDVEDGDLSEGDMKFLPGQLLVRGSVSRSLWPNGVVFYDIEDSLAFPNVTKAIQKAMNAWTTKTNNCIRFKKRTSETSYISFFKGFGCFSYVGRTGSKQRLSLGDGCLQHGIVVHEIGHALGFLHEQSRPDRDNYVEIKFENIQSGKQGNFKKSSSIDSLGTPYDYGSIMHYGEFYFSKNKQQTIVPKQSGKPIGQRDALSPIDIKQMKLLYKCSGGGTNPTLPPSGSFACNFDKDLCGFKQDRDDKFDWIRRSGKTPSAGTGPSGDHTSGSGSYAYIETSRPRVSGDNAVLSRVVQLSGKSCLRFYYHMYGGNMGTLKVKLSENTIFEMTGDQKNQWNMADKIRLQGRGSMKLTFEGIRSNSFRGDAAIDDILIYDC